MNGTGNQEQILRSAAPASGDQNDGTLKLSSKQGSAEFAFFELCGSWFGQAADFLRGESLRYPLFRA